MELLHSAMWHDHDTDFARWLHPEIWHMALESWQWIHQVAAPCNVADGLGWHAKEFAQTSAILELYIWFRCWPLSPQSTCHSAPVCEMLSDSNHHQQKKIDVMSIFKMADLRHFGFWGLVMASLKSPCTTFHRSSIVTIALNCLVFEKIAFFLHFGDKQTERQTVLPVASGGLIINNTKNPNNQT